MICRWKKEFLANASVAFENPKNDDSAFEKERDRLLRKIGELEIDQDFVVRASQKFGIPLPKMKVSMDVGGRAKDNIKIERFWKTIKYKYIFLTPAETVIELR